MNWEWCVQAVPRVLLSAAGGGMAVEIYNLCDIWNRRVRRAFLPFAVPSVHSVACIKMLSSPHRPASLRYTLPPQPVRAAVCQPAVWILASFEPQINADERRYYS